MSSNDLGRQIEDAEEYAERGRDSVAAHLKTLVSDAESLLRSARSASRDGFETARDRLERTLETARRSLSDMDVRGRVDDARESAEHVRQRVAHAARASGEYMSEHPLGTLIAVGAVAFVVGMLVARSREEDYWS